MPYVETNGVDTYYEDYGGGQPIVVLHGAFTDHQVWTEQLQPLTEEYRLLLYDLRGHGKTGGSDLGRYTVDTYADDLVAFIEALELTQPVVFGHSMGGMIGYTFTDSYPERLSALVTVGSSSPQLLTGREWVLKKGMTRLHPLIAKSERVMKGLQWVQETLFDGGSVELSEFQQIRDTHDCNPPELDSTEQGKINRVVEEYLESSRTLELSEVPILMLYGEDEPMIKPHAEYFERQFDECQTVEIPEGTHNAQIDNPEFIRTQTRKFLAEVVGGRDQAVSS